MVDFDEPDRDIEKTDSEQGSDVEETTTDPNSTQLGEWSKAFTGEGGQEEIESSSVSSYSRWSKLDERDKWELLSGKGDRDEKEKMISFLDKISDCLGDETVKEVMEALDKDGYRKCYSYETTDGRKKHESYRTQVLFQIGNFASATTSYEEGEEPADQIMDQIVDLIEEDTYYENPDIVEDIIANILYAYGTHGSETTQNLLEVYNKKWFKGIVEKMDAEMVKEAAYDMRTYICPN